MTLVRSPFSCVITYPLHFRGVGQVLKTPTGKGVKVEGLLQGLAFAQVWPDECGFVPSSPLDGFEDYGPDRDSMRLTAFLDVPGQGNLPPLARLEKYAFSENVFNR